MVSSRCDLCVVRCCGKLDFILTNNLPLCLWMKSWRNFFAFLGLVAKTLGTAEDINISPCAGIFSQANTRVYMFVSSRLVTVRHGVWSDGYLNADTFKRLIQVITISIWYHLQFVFYPHGLFSCGSPPCYVWLQVCTPSLWTCPKLYHLSFSTVVVPAVVENHLFAYIMDFTVTTRCLDLKKRKKAVYCADYMLLCSPDISLSLS